MSSEPLTQTEKEDVLKTWSLVKTDLKGNGTKFFIHFFTVQPRFQQMFPGFGKIPLEQLSTSKRLAAHGYTVMNSIGTLIDNLEDPDMLTELLHKIGHNHYRRKVTIEDFHILRGILLDFLGKALSDAWTPSASSGWKKVLDIVVAKIGEGLKAAANGETD